MKKLSFIAAVLVFSAVAGTPTAVGTNEGNTRCACSRIVSLAPSITETLFALGLGDRVVGVTRYCRFPAAALTKAKVGGYYDPNYEEIVRLKPDLIIMLAEHKTPDLHCATLAVSHDSIAQILESIARIGGRCGAAVKAKEMTADIMGEIDTIKRRVRGLHRPRVLVSVGRAMGSSAFTAAGERTFYNEMITLAGGTNALENTAVPFPMVSTEGMLRINPEIIIEMVPDSCSDFYGTEKGWKPEKAIAGWNKIPAVDAVKNRRVHLFAQDYALIPGPRFIYILEQMARVIHPEIHWN